MSKFTVSVNMSKKDYNIKSNDHPYQILTNAWARCFQEHVKGYVDRENISLNCKFTVEKFQDFEDHDKEIKSLSVSFSGKDFSKKDKKVISNIVKICDIYQILQRSCDKPLTIKFV